MKPDRGSGILLHITSLPGEEGCGTMGEEAYRFADFLNKSEIMYWQILPIGPVSGGMSFSPYASVSTFAGNPLFISLKKLTGAEWYAKTNIDFPLAENPEQADFDKAAAFKMPLFREASAAFFSRKNAEHENYESFCSANAFWLEDYALFSAVSAHFGTDDYHKWDKPIALRQPEALAAYSKKLAEDIRFHKFLQYIFFSQWTSLKSYCNSLNIKIIGDLPLYISADGADVWANPGIFQLDENNKPTSVAGVPPDYFSSTGQHWGNPLYKWFKRKKKLNKPTVKWWINRIKHLNNHLDIIRIDHFRGFESYWAVPSGEKTAENGTWKTGPGPAFFRKLKKELGNLPLIAEDLGVITPEVEKLRDEFELPGMKILQFAFDRNNKNSYLPHNIRNTNCIVYTGTHDNNTTNGWFYNEIDDDTRHYIMEYIGTDDFSAMHLRFIRAAYASSAALAVIPMQDILGFGEEHRMNIPGTTEKNWIWRCAGKHINDELAQKLNIIGALYNRSKGERR